MEQPGLVQYFYTVWVAGSNPARRIVLFFHAPFLLRGQTFLRIVGRTMGGGETSEALPPSPRGEWAYKHDKNGARD